MAVLAKREEKKRRKEDGETEKTFITKQFRKRQSIFRENVDKLEELRNCGFEEDVAIASKFFLEEISQQVLAVLYSMSDRSVSMRANAVIRYQNPRIKVNSSAKYHAELMRKLVADRKTEERINSELGLGHLPTRMPPRMMKTLKEIVRAKKNGDVEFLELKLSKSLLLTFGLDNPEDPQYRSIRKVANLLNATYYQVQSWIERAKDQLRRLDYGV